MRQNDLMIMLTRTAAAITTTTTRTFQVVNGLNSIHNLTQLTPAVESRMVVLETWASVGWKEVRGEWVIRIYSFLIVSVDSLPNYKHRYLLNTKFWTHCFAWDF